MAWTMLATSSLQNLSQMTLISLHRGLPHALSPYLRHIFLLGDGCLDFQHCLPNSQWLCESSQTRHLFQKIRDKTECLKFSWISFVHQVKIATKEGLQNSKTHHCHFLLGFGIIYIFPSRWDQCGLGTFLIFISCHCYPNSFLHYYLWVGRRQILTSMHGQTLVLCPKVQSSQRRSVAVTIKQSPFFITLKWIRRSRIS